MPKVYNDDNYTSHFRLIAVQPLTGAGLADNLDLNVDATQQTGTPFDIEFVWTGLDNHHSLFWYGSFSVGYGDNSDFFGRGYVLVNLVEPSPEPQPWLEEALWIDPDPLDDTITIFARFDRGIQSFDLSRFQLAVCDGVSNPVAAASVNHPADTAFENLGDDWLVIEADSKPGNMGSDRSDQICSLIVTPDGVTDFADVYLFRSGRNAINAYGSCPGTGLL